MPQRKERIFLQPYHTYVLLFKKITKKAKSIKRLVGTPDGVLANSFPIREIHTQRKITVGK